VINDLLLVLITSSIVSGAAPLVAELLLACPHLKILATSREALRAPGEWLYPVPVLDFPKLPQLQTADINTISQFSALTLFEERARAVRPDFVLNRDVGVSAICGRLDGLPLAIELVSAASVMSPQALLARLSDLLIASDGMELYQAPENLAMPSPGVTTCSLMTRSDCSLVSQSFPAILPLRRPNRPSRRPCSKDR
jgi:hypothetical protein